MNVSAVIKIGGSLLDLPDLADRLQGFLGDFSRPYPIAVCGGGRVVDICRDWDCQHNLGEEPSHWLALQALSVTAAFVERAVPLFAHVQSPTDFPSLWRRRRVPLYDAHAFIRDIDEKSASPLPRRWRVTTDSIAARMAQHFGAQEVILLKSVDLPTEITLAEAARDGFVDPHFPSAARDIPRIVTVNLRAPGPSEQILTPAPFDRRS
jgi:aspartokinase-like uncharacterized kinase